MNTSARVALGVFAVLVVVGLAAYMFMFARDADTDEGTMARMQLPASPEQASYSIDGTEVSLTDGQMRLVGTPVYDDINDDGIDDGIVLLTRLEGEKGVVSYYVAAALKDEDGYLGSNALLVDDHMVPKSVEVLHTVITVTYRTDIADHGLADEPAPSVTRYYMVSGARLHEVTLKENEQLIAGALMQNREEKYTFFGCNEEVYHVASSSRSYAALEAIYYERTKHSSATPAPMILIGHVDTFADEEDGDMANLLAVRQILDAPETVVCEVADQQ